MPGFQRQFKIVNRTCKSRALTGLNLNFKVLVSSGKIGGLDGVISPGMAPDERQILHDLKPQLWIKRCFFFIDPES
jgi:hypothetical protein